uniref:Si:ch211-168b3.2 n=1 Tax=Cyprinus carpio TaxID=7962 RepID=A0A8C1YTG9_CYPCA
GMQFLINLLSSLLSATDSTGIPKDYSAWPIVLGALTAVLSVGLLIALAVRYRFFRCHGESSDDDDGFIEDNYIQATEREEDKEEEIQQEDAEYSDDELVIPYVN